MFSKNKSFTLIELLIVIAIIAIIAVGIIILIIPGERLAQARDATRASHIKNLETALYLYDLDHGLDNLTIEKNLIEICNTEVATPICTDLIDLSDLGITIPVDPLGGIDSNGTGYFIHRDGEGKIGISAEQAETQNITIGPKGYTEGPHVIAGDTIYVDSSSYMWTPTADLPATGTNGQTYAWSSTFQEAHSCIGQGDDFEACHYCDNLNYAGFTDWVLPHCDSKTADEDCLLYTFWTDVCDGSSCGSGNTNMSWDINASTSYYWASTEADSFSAWGVHFLGGSVGVDGKVSSNSVRCVRGQ